HRLHLRLRLPRLPWRPDVLRRHDRPQKSLRPRLPIRKRARLLVEALAAVETPRRSGPDLRRFRPAKVGGERVTTPHRWGDHPPTTSLLTTSNPADTRSAGTCPLRGNSSHGRPSRPR